MCTVHGENVSTNHKGKEEGGMHAVHVENEDTNHKGTLKCMR